MLRSFRWRSRKWRRSRIACTADRGGGLVVVGSPCSTARLTAHRLDASARMTALALAVLADSK